MEALINNIVEYLVDKYVDKVGKSVILSTIDRLA
jgi:hypothetical protein